MALKKICKCGCALVFHVRSGSWLCPRIEDSPLAGLIEPGNARVAVARAVSLFESTRVAEHLTCMPAELWDEDFEVTPDHLWARGMRVEMTPADREAERREHQRQRAAESIAKLPAAGPGSREQLNTYSCSDCGYRTPSDSSMNAHLDREGHAYGETPSGKRTQPSASARSRPLSKEARRAAARNTGVLR